MREAGITRRDAARLIVLGGMSCLWASRFAFSQAGTLERILERTRMKHRLPGLAAAVVRGGKVAACGVTGVRRQGAADKIELDDRFHIASCTKSMTATLAAIAVQEGRFQWGTSLAEALPALAEKVRPEYRSSTLEQMLAHSARMPAYTQLNPQRGPRRRR